MRTADGVPATSDRQLVARVQATVHSRLREVLDGAREVALLDFPYHRNAGDAAIWAGELAALDALGVRVAYVADAGRYDLRRLQGLAPAGPVLLHGGGSVGDLWPWPQALRERVLQDLPGRTVVQLPQSVHFRSTDNERQFRDIVQRHGRYVLLARDRESLHRAQALDPAHAILAPDMAFGLGPLDRASWSRGPRESVAALARDDIEETSGLRAAATGLIPLHDWRLGPLGDARWQATRTLPRLGRLMSRTWHADRVIQPLVDAALHSMHRQVLHAGLRLLAGVDVLVTDRLHAHLLCTLLDVPHVVLDNSYGKISALHAAWTSDSVTTHWGEDAHQAIAHALRLGGRLR